MSIRISEKESGRTLGNISERDLEILIDHMEEESSTDQDYFVEHTAIDALERLGASSEFIALLRRATGTSAGIDIVWSRN
ncbi:hypothetical protein UUA_02636 [Rhodanobacter thiooxydans LCS2]|nr:hypothetical protein UUA_02636 [Rhodanobacter thiooxydans LCS2]